MSQFPAPAPTQPIAAPAGQTQVWLIGAGPGDAELLTVKAVKALAQAEVILVDDLVGPDVLALARPEARIISVGKRGGRASHDQATIMALLLEQLAAGHRVARLKGGDPYIFGRGGEELQALQALGINVEVIPGITAGIAAPGSIGLAVTHRAHSQGVIFVTGHGADGQMPDWQALAACGLSLVIYMGMQRLPAISQALLQAGMAPHTPAAVIVAATRPEQCHLLATLDTLATQVQRRQLASPAIVVIGAAAGSATVQPGLEAQ